MVAMESNEAITGEISSDQPNGLYYKSASYAPGSAGGTSGKQGKSTMSENVDRRQANAMGVSQSSVAGGGTVSQGG